MECLRLICRCHRRCRGRGQIRRDLDYAARIVEMVAEPGSGACGLEEEAHVVFELVDLDAPAFLWLLDARRAAERDDHFVGPADHISQQGV